MGKVDQREKELLQELNLVKTMEMSYIEKRFAISSATARRMCGELERQGKLMRGVGVVRALNAAAQDGSAYVFKERAQQNAEEKRAIAHACARRVKDDSIVFLSGGTTLYQMAIALEERMRQGELKNVIVMTNAIDNVAVLSQSGRVVLTGGDYRVSHRDLAGAFCEQAIQRSRFDQAFVGVDGIDVEGGLMTMDIDTAHVDQLVLSRSRESCILADHSKFTQTSFINYSEIDSSVEIFTDDGVSPETIMKAKVAGIRLWIADERKGNQAHE